MSATPPPGVFVRQVGGFATGYCLEILRVLNCDATHAPGIRHVTARRWGLDGRGQPFDDGHCTESHNSYYTDRFKSVGSKAWRLQSGHDWLHLPLYWRQIDLKPTPTPSQRATQQDLFA